MSLYSMQIENYKIVVYRKMIAVIKIKDLIYLIFYVMCGFIEVGRDKKAGLWRL